MAVVYQDHRRSYVWLNQGGHGVIGFPLDELNNRIDFYNKTSRMMDFWDWLTFDTGYVVTGFSVLWNDNNPLMSQVHSIKG